MKANDSAWPSFYGKFVNYPRFKKEWHAYRESYHAVVSNNLAAKTLREKCVKGDAWKMVVILRTYMRSGTHWTCAMKGQRSTLRIETDFGVQDV
jgi:hypothetical protein